MSNEPVKAQEAKRPAWFRYLFNFKFFSDEQPKISPQAVVDAKAEISDDVEIGPFCVIGPGVKIDGGCRLLNSVTIVGQTTIGRDNIFFPNSVIGTAPQDKKFKGAPTRLDIGHRNAFREAVTIHVGTEKGGGVTSIGDDNLLMVNAHIGHDARIANCCVLANNVMIAGHVTVQDHVWMAGAVGVHHFVTIGTAAYLAGAARISHDVPPFVKVQGDNEIRAFNKVGLQRAGTYSAQDIEAIGEACRALFLDRGRRPLEATLTELASASSLNPHVRGLIDFMRQRHQGKHGRFQENFRARDTAAGSPSITEPPPPQEISQDHDGNGSAPAE